MNKDLLKCLKQGLKIFLCKIGMHDWKYQPELDFTIFLQIFVIRIIWERFRTSLSKLRLSSHRLEEETGRWAKPNKIPYEHRKCKICDTLEDEFHFVFECALYVDKNI